MKMNKWLTSGIITSLLMSMLVGCGTSKTNTPTTTQTTAPVKKVDFPTKPISLLVPFAAGGGTDATARTLAKAAEKTLGQPITVENKTGAGGAVGMTAGSTAKADGYTVTMVTVELATMSHIGISPLTYEAFKPVAQVNFDPATITVKADSPWKTAKEFLAYVKANPTKVKVGNAGAGSIWHLAAASVEKTADVKFTHIPFEGAAPAVTALLGGHVDAVMVSPAEVKTQVEAGKLRTLAIFDAKESPALPGVKTFEAETGLKPDTYVGTFRGIAVPKDTPDDVVKVLSDAFTKAAADAEFTDYMKKNGLGINVKESKAFGDFLKQNHESFGKIIPTLGLKK
jgi:tripartite-type tricarboxylate transporter receptor subunit TctC